VPIETITATKKVVNVAAHYNTERLAPKFEHFEGKPLFVMTGDTA
jgi:hypothetical protein